MQEPGTERLASCPNLSRTMMTEPSYKHLTQGLVKKFPVASSQLSPYQTKQQHLITAPSLISFFIWLLERHSVLVSFYLLAVPPHLLCWFFLIPQPPNDGGTRTLIYALFLCDLMSYCSFTLTTLKCISLGYWFSTGGSFIYQGSLAKFGEMLGCHKLGCWCYWHLVGEIHGSCSTPHSAQHSP